MKKLLAMFICFFMMAWLHCPAQSRVRPINPRVQPDEETTYVIKYWDVELPAVMDVNPSYALVTQEIIDEFCALYSNVQVEVRWLPWAEAQAELEAALKAGSPPDLFADWQGIANYNHVLQIPAGLYMTDELWPAAARGVTRQGQVWAWPRFVQAGGLMVLARNLDMSGYELEALLDQQWDWEQFGEWLEMQNLALVANDYRGVFSGQLLLAATGRTFAQGAGGPEVEEVFEQVAGLRDTGQALLGEYQSLVNGKNMLAGAPPVMLSWMAKYYPGETVVMLPLPGMHGQPQFYPVTIYSLLQFRQLSYRGDDHSRMAALLAEYVAREQAARLSCPLWTVPPYKDYEWQHQDLNSSHYSYFLDALTKGMPSQAVDLKEREREQKLNQELVPILTQFWAGKMESGDVARWLLDYGSGEND